MNLESMPDGLHGLQYAAKVCEETLGLPATKGNLELVAACIDAVGKKLFRGRDDAAKMGCFVLTRRIEEAQAQGIKITGHWLRDGGYWEVDRPTKMSGVPRFEHYGQGYGGGDMVVLWKLYRAKREQVKRPLSDAEVELLLAELDSKRGGAPGFRQ